MSIDNQLLTHKPSRHPPVPRAALASPGQTRGTPIQLTGNLFVSNTLDTEIRHGQSSGHIRLACSRDLRE